MLRVITIRCKGGSTEFEERQMATLDKQEKLQAQLEAIDKEFYDLRKQNQAQYEEQFRPLEEGLLQRAMQPAREATSARAREAEYGAADTSSREALARRNERFGISNESQQPDGDDDYIRAIALTAVGNTSKDAARDTQSRLQTASLGIGSGINQDIGRSFGRSISGMQQGLGHADAAFSNFSNAQQHENNAYLAQQQGYGALIQSGMAIGQMGISNYNTAAYSGALGGQGAQATFGSAFSAQPSGGNPSAGNLYGTPLN